MRERRPVHPAWGYSAAAALFFAATAAAAVAPFTTPASPDRVAGVLFGFELSSAAALQAVLEADERVRLVDIRWNGRLLFVSYRDPAFPDKVAKLGAWRTFDAVAAGCHGDTGFDRASNAPRPE